MWCRSHRADAYSIWGLTIVRYADSLTFLEQLLRLRFRKLRVVVAFEDMADMCEDQDIVIYLTLEGEKL